VTALARSRHAIRFRGRSFLALVLAPARPLDAWLDQLDHWTARSPGFFIGRPVVLDLQGLAPEKPELAALIAALHARDIRIMALEGADPNLPGLGMPPVVDKARQAGTADILDAHAPQQPASLLIDAPVRSGQSIAFPKGDVTVLGSVAWGAEIVAGGSIHIYGTLRGRAIAGSTGQAGARIFCRKFEAELLGIDGLFKAADEIGPELRGQAVQAWLEGDGIRMALLN
jgi:septum site-determining protein MinC